MKSKTKIAVVGIGLMGSQHLKAIKNSKKAVLHSIVDINEIRMALRVSKISHARIRVNLPT